MSGQWEVVGKKKDKSSKIPQQMKKDNSNKKKSNLVTQNVEEILPMSQVKNLYKTAKVNKESQVAREKTNVHENGIKKPQKKEKHNDPPKPKPPKSIESALNAIVVDDFKNIYESCKQRFPDTPVVWLKELVQFLNQRVQLDVPDPVFRNKPDGYPLSVVPIALKDLIALSIKESGRNNVLLFFDITLNIMTTDMSKGLPSLGHKLYLQYIAINDPKSVVNNISKTVVLRNSYQNRPPVGLSILWVLAQAGVKDFQVAVKVLEDIMLPLVDLKNYSRYVLQYLVNIINLHSNSAITKEQYLLFLDVVCHDRKNSPADLNKKLTKTLPKLKDMLFEGSTEQKYHLIFDTLFKKLNNSIQQYQDALCDVLVSCLVRDDKTLDVWSKNYNKYNVQSSTLLNYLGQHWDSVGKQIKSGAFSEFLHSAKGINDDLILKKRKDAGLVKTKVTIERLINKMAAKKSPSGYSYRKLVYLLLALLGAVLYFDCREGGWQNSQTKKTLYTVTHVAVDKVKFGADKANLYFKNNFPQYHEKVVAFGEPYVDLARDFGITTYNLFVDIKESVVTKYPEVIKSIDSYAPGLIEKTGKTACNVWTTSALYFNNGVSYLKNEVFVGQLSPENMKRFVSETFLVTQQKATEYYHWIYEKVQTTIK